MQQKKHPKDSHEGDKRGEWGQESEFFQNIPEKKNYELVQKKKKEKKKKKKKEKEKEKKKKYMSYLISEEVVGMLWI